MSELNVITGTMNGGKSLEIISKHYDAVQSNANVLCLKPSVDTRDVGVIKSRIGLEVPCYQFDKDVNLFAFVYGRNLVEKIDKIMVDESQFITKEQAHELHKVATMLDIPVDCYGLKISFTGDGFDGMKELLTLTKEPRVIKSTCRRCKGEATHHLLKVNGKYVFNSLSNVFIGDAEYTSVCAKCWYEEKDRSEGLL